MKWIKRLQNNHTNHICSWKRVSGCSCDDDSIVSDSDESKNEMWRKGIDDVLSADGKEMIKERRETLKQRAVREAKRKIMEERFLKRSKKVSRILTSVQMLVKKLNNLCKIQVQVLMHGGELVCSHLMEIES